MQKLNIIGLMSGTSLDGLDIAACTFWKEASWKYELKFSKTFEYSAELKSNLRFLDNSTSIEFERINHKLGNYMGQCVNRFIESNGFQTDYISSHGHTIFHQPEDNLTSQIGHPAALNAITNTPVIADFRSQDVHLGGQGAPLVPIGDQLLFREFDYCLNLGGIANISIKSRDSITAFDITFANMALNHLAQKRELEFDKDGEIASSGQLIPDLFSELNRLDFHNNEPPKSIGKEWFDNYVRPILDKYLDIADLRDVMNTCCEVIAKQIANTTNSDGRLMITGGGAKNTYLVNRISELSMAKIHLPSNDIIDFKEAIIFGFLGALRINNEINILSSVTGARHNHIAGCIYG